ncbi:MAG TPA: hypothetical protein VGK56_10930 [Anaerolineales bacterium]
MRTNNFPQSAIGWMAIATGVSVILAALFLLLMYTVEPSFGKLNDMFNAILGSASGLLAWMLYPQHHARSPLLSQIALILALVGVIFTIVGSVLIIYDFTGFVLAGWYTAVGNALIGLWLAAFCYATLRERSDILPRSLVRFGLMVGAIMALGLLGIVGILAGVDSMESLPWYLLLGFFSFTGTYLLYPIWTIWLGRRMAGE